jgi:hypothetical protein
LNALLDSDVLLDFLDGHAPAAREIARYRECCIRHHFLDGGDGRRANTSG